MSYSTSAWCVRTPRAWLWKHHFSHAAAVLGEQWIKRSWRLKRGHFTFYMELLHRIWTCLWVGLKPEGNKEVWKKGWKKDGWMSSLFIQRIHSNHLFLIITRTAISIPWPHAYLYEKFSNSPLLFSEKGPWDIFDTNLITIITLITGCWQRSEDVCVFQVQINCWNRTTLNFFRKRQG